MSYGKVFYLFPNIDKLIALSESVFSFILYPYIQTLKSVIYEFIVLTAIENPYRNLGFLV